GERGKGLGGGGEGGVAPPGGAKSELFMAPLGVVALGDGGVPPRIGGAAHRRNIAACDQLHPSLCNRENIRESSQRFGIVAPQKPDPRVPGGQRNHARGVVIVACTDVVAERHRARYSGESRACRYKVNTTLTKTICRRQAAI